MMIVYALTLLFSTSLSAQQDSNSVYENLLLEQTESPFDPLISYNLGVASYKREAFERAHRHFAQAQDLGVHELDMGVECEFNKAQSALMQVRKSLDATNNHPKGEELTRDIALCDEAIEGYLSVLSEGYQDPRASQNRKAAKELKAMLEQLRNLEEREEREKQQQNNGNSSSEKECGDGSCQNSSGQNQAGSNGSKQPEPGKQGAQGGRNTQQSGNREAQEGDPSQESSQPQQGDGQEDAGQDQGQPSGNPRGNDGEKADKQGDSGEEQSPGSAHGLPNDSPDASTQENEEKDGVSSTEGDEASQEDDGAGGFASEQDEEESGSHADAHGDEAEQAAAQEGEAAGRPGGDAQDGADSEKQQGVASAVSDGDAGEQMSFAMKRAHVFLDKLEQKESRLHKQQLLKKTARQKQSYKKYNQW